MRKLLRMGKTSAAMAVNVCMIRRGELYFADLDPVVGSEQGGRRPVLILQNDTGNRFSPTVIVAALTTRTEKARLPTHILVRAHQCGLDRDSVILLEQLRTVDKRRLGARLGVLPASVLREAERALRISLGVSVGNAK